MKWEYQRVRCGTVHESDMDVQGENGWELVQIIDESGTEEAIFKRPLPDADQDTLILVTCVGSRSSLQCAAWEAVHVRRIDSAKSRV